MLKCLLGKITQKQHLTAGESDYIMKRIMDGTVSDVHLGALLAALAVKGATETELASFAGAMRKYSLQVSCPMDTFDIVGTGGDAAKTFNISTTAAIVVAAGGVLVAKHGNRAKTSRSGSADMLEALGVNIFLSPESCMEMLEQIGICYFYTRYYYYMMKHIDVVREQLGISTIFDVLRPLINPAHAKYEILGVNDPSLLEPMAHVLDRLGVRHGMVVYGQDHSDEISAAASTAICEVTDHQYTTYQICPEQFALPRGSRDELRGGTPKENAAIARQVFKGERGTRRTSILMNAGAGLYVSGNVLTLEAGIKKAGQLIDSGQALEKLEDLIRMSQNMRVVEKVKLAAYRD
ncbi:anthranilate phosphoribosyltransferase [Megasphaera cerevisiae DSM 20462]|jgi:anthranilate phosphoribosyltransferase|uniref:Anthranilate phosphoribosyltransferase n=1 Tax=Megasphaera cerevisiae DSM 20462 TaxID=1122219 RepID=A0A0J6WUV0_9FIRM|nr:anthranilate phosphoribosyltransferase [Megasphaera cerevisiae]KMO85537.1 anthranilate phosphoribosyltransferase [Megasphaera cerevisiae DSM 20462]OKY52903.1 anthranilate phosphoribosyltransferase [Megasphaera cerevisiae]SJZ74722.1 anthranilate phosphoribosyltransferase [Megasphaera cerevisiae DSM 20462]